MAMHELAFEEFDSIYELLAEAKLDFSDLKQPYIRLFRFDMEGQTIGVGALEVFDDLALLRSVAVKNEFQGKGLGKEMVAQIEQAARESGIKSFYLLTNTAPEFFRSIGYRQIDRNDFAKPLKQTAQFAGLCPVSAVCMKKKL